MTPGDVAAWVSALVAVIGVVIAAIVAWKQIANPKEGADASDRAAKAARDQADRAEAMAHVARSRELFTAITGLPKVDVNGEHFTEAKEMALKLYAHLGADRRARYITSAAMAFFAYGRERSDVVRMKRLEDERRRIEEYLSKPGNVWEMPTDGPCATGPWGHTRARDGAARPGCCAPRTLPSRPRWWPALARP